MYFINNKIVKSIANEIYRNAGFEENDDYYVVYDNQFKDMTFTVAFTVHKNNPDEMFEYKHFVITFIEDKGSETAYIYHYTDTLNRRELADKLLEIIHRYEYLKGVSA